MMFRRNAAWCCSSFSLSRRSQLLRSNPQPRQVADNRTGHTCYSRERSKRSHRTNKRRGHEPFAGDADLELPQRRDRSTPDRFAGDEKVKRVDARSADEVGTTKCAPRSVGTFRSRLDAEAVLGAGHGATQHSADRLSESVVAGYSGPLTARVVYVDAKDEADLQRFKGKLKGAIVLTAPMREVKARFEPMGTRRDEKNLLALADAPEPTPGGGRAVYCRTACAASVRMQKYLFFQRRRRRGVG